MILKWDEKRHKIFIKLYKSLIEKECHELFLTRTSFAHGAACIAFHCSNIYNTKIWCYIYWSNGRLYMQPHGFGISWRYWGREPIRMRCYVTFTNVVLCTI